MEKVSIIMPIYNGARYLSMAIESVLLQDYYDFELICIDDDSTDDSKDAIFSFKDKRIIYLFQEHYGAPSRGRNVGIRKSQGNYLIFLDQDDILKPNSLSLRLEFLLNNPNIFFVYSDTEIIDKNNNIINKSGLNYFNLKPFDGECFNNLFIKNFIQSVMVKKEVFEKVGLFNENMIGTDDYEMWLRIAYYYPLAFLNKQLVQYRWHTESLSKKSQIMDQNFVNCLDSIISLFPDLINLIGKSLFRKRMFECLYDAAYAHCLSKDYKLARINLYRALQYKFNLKLALLLFFLFSSKYMKRLLNKHYDQSKERKN